MRFAALWLAGTIIAVFMLQFLLGTDGFVLVKSLMWQQPWRIVTALFAHAGVAHLLSNLFGLVLFGLLLEGRVGPKRVLWLFLISGVLINVFTLYPRSLGASGAIYAIMGALVVLRPFMVIWLNWMPMPIVVASIIWIAQNVIGGYLPDGVANAAHLGGLGIGAVAGLWWRRQGFGDRIAMEKRQRDPALERKLDRWEKQYMLRKKP